MPRARTLSLIPLLTLAVVALIAYGSLYPFNFKPDAIEGGVLEALRQLSWARAGRGDRISNVLLYLPLGFCLFLWINLRLNRRTAILLALLLGSLLSLMMEVAQVYVSARVPSFTDLTLNAAGTLMGAAMGFTWRVLSGLMHVPGRPEQRQPDGGAAILIGLWLAWRWAPFTPQLDLGKLKAALQPLFNPQFDALAVFTYLTYWLVVQSAVATLVSRQRSLEVLLLLIAAVMGGRLIVANQAFVPSELLALLLLLPCVVLIHRMHPGVQRGVLLVAVLATLVVSRLAPFEFTATPSYFDWWPFLHWLDAGWLTALLSIDWVDLFALLFVYGALLWVLRQREMTVNWAAGVVCALCVVLELIQMWMPARTAAITDPVLVAILALCFRSAYAGERKATVLRGHSR